MNIIQAVEYLRAHPEAIITRGNGKIQLQRDACILASNSISLTVNDIMEDWIHQGNVKPHRTHAEIMRNWFMATYRVWDKVKKYDQCIKNNKYYIYHEWVSRDYFDTLEMKTQEEIEAME